MTKRPIECGRCAKRASILYQEIEGDATTYTEMCVECPALKARLGSQTDAPDQKIGAMCCVRCHTSLDQIKEEGQLGCSNCYTVFSQYITELNLMRGLTPPFHKGRAPNIHQHLTLPEQMCNLSTALNQALKKENYEEAALLRDQIQDLMGESDA